jgi:hypothetical protein
VGAFQPQLAQNAYYLITYCNYEFLYLIEYKITVNLSATSASGEAHSAHFWLIFSI